MLQSNRKQQINYKTMRQFLLSLLLIITIQIGLKAQVEFATNIFQGCAPLTITFTNMSTQGATFEWYFGDGGSATTYNAQHTFTSGGYYEVYLYAYDGSGNYIGSDFQGITIFGGTDYFYVYPEVACPGTEIYFDPSNDYILSTYWNFGDGFTSTEYYPYHSFDNFGTYTVTLVLETQCGYDTIYRDVNITNNLPMSTDCSMGANNYYACPGAEIEFYSYSSDAQTYFWDFGDGNTAQEQYPVNVYASAGVYNFSVTMTNACGSDTTLYSEFVMNIDNNVPVVEYAQVYSYPQESCPGQYVQLYTNLDNTYSYEWDFGDGTLYYDSYVNYAFADLGSHNYSVKITNSCGNDTTLYGTVTVSTGLPFAGSCYIYTESYEACPGENLYFSGEGEQAVNYYWNFGDGYTSTEQYPSHSYNSFGNYTVSLTMENSCGSDTTVYADISINNNVSIPTSAQIYYWPQENCPNQYINFYSNLNDSYSFEWDFGDGTTYTESGVNYAFPYTGSFEVALTISNTCGSSSTIYQTVDITNGQPFSGYCELNHSVSEACPNEEIYFYGYGEQAVNYYWNFGDGYTSEESNVYHTYESYGNYTVSLTMTNGCGNDTTLYSYISINNSSTVPSYAEIFPSPEQGCPNQYIYFYVNLNDSYSFEWDFGDGSSYNYNGVNYTFGAVGSYNVSVNITNSCGNDTTIYTTMNITNNVPFSGYCYASSSQGEVCPGDNVFFESQGNEAQNYFWNFGDGTTSEEQNPTHAYSALGTYNYSVTMTNACGNDTTLTGQINVVDDIQLPTNVEFYYYPQGICPSQNVYFYSNYGNSYTHLWNFGDGTTSNESGVYHKYTAPGTYNVSLKLSNGCGSSQTIFKSVNVSDNIPYAGYIDYYIENQTACPNTRVYFNSWAENASSYIWNFGDGTSSNNSNASHMYSNTGTYNVSLTVANACGMDSTVYTTVEIVNDLPIEYLSYDISTTEVCPGDNITFSTYGNSSYLWNFGDGTTSASDWTQHKYTTEGVYNASLTVSNECGSDSTVNFVITVSGSAPFSEYVYVYQYPDQYSQVCPGEEIEFYVDDEYDCVWNFGDGTTSTSNDEQHVYSSVGTYDISVTLTNGCGNDTTIYSSVEVTNDNQIDFLHFGFNASNVCPNTEISFWTEHYATYLWNFGDGTTSTIREPNHSYSTPGNYNVTLTVTNHCGYQASRTQMIEVENGLDFNYAMIYYSPSNAVCPNSPISFYAEDNDMGVSYLWDFGDGSIGYGQEPQHTYNSVGEYNVELEIVNGCGISISVYETVSVESDVIPSADSYEIGIVEDVVCPNDPAIIYVFPAGNTYSVDFGDGTIVTESEQIQVEGTIDLISHPYTTTGSYNINVTVINTCGNSFTYSVPVSVENGVSMQGSFDHNESGYVGESIPFIGAGGSAYSWNFGDGTIFAENNVALSMPTHIYQAAGTYTVSLTITNSCGVSQTFSDAVEIYPAVVELTANLEVTNISCFGLSDGSISVASVTNGTSPYTYLWSNGATTSSINYLAKGMYSVTVTDASSNVDVVYATVSEPAKITAAITTTDASCGTPDGTATVSATGGTTPYSYQWNNGQNTSTIDSLASGYYFVYVIDANQCLGTAQGTVNDGNGPSITLNTLTNVSCNGGTNGSIDISVTGGSGAYSYVWSNGASTQDISNLLAGPYEVVVTDANLCQAVKSYVITQPSAIQISSGINNATCGSSNGSITAYVSGGTSPYSYAWSNGTSTSTNTGLGVGVYKLTVTDAATCQKQKSIAVSEIGAPNVYVSDVQNIECGETAGSITVSVSGGTGAYSYLWSSGETTQNLSGIGAGNYTLTVTDSGCHAIVEAEIETNTPDIPQICVVTVDSVLGSNMIVWERPTTTNIQSYNVYKESSMAGIYFEIGNVAYDSVSVFVDTFSNPLLRSWRYKISAIDMCGGESELSDLHKTIHLTVNQGIGNSVNLIWDEYEGIDYLSYYIYRKSLTTNWVAIDSLPSTLSSYTDNVVNVQQYFYTIGIKTNDVCDPNTLFKTQLGPYSQSISNMDDNGKIDNDGVNENKFFNNVTLYPNPTDGSFSIRIDDETRNNIMIDIYNMQGQLIYSMQKENVVNSIERVNLSDNAKGIYFVKIVKGDKIAIQKIVLK